MTPDDVYQGTRLAILEMIRSGTTHFNDMYWHADAVARAVDELGVRAHIGSVFIDHGDEAVARRWRDDVLRRIDERHDLPPRAQIAIAPHAIYTVSPANLDWLAGLARDHDLLLHIHLSETRGEVEECVATHGVRPTGLLERVGALGPNLIAAHGVYLDAEELAMLGEVGATVVHNPAANMKLATGRIFDYDAARQAGVRVVLGTDGAGSNNNLDLIEEMKLAALIQKHRAQDATSLPAPEALAMATTAPPGPSDSAPAASSPTSPPTSSWSTSPPPPLSPSTTPSPTWSTQPAAPSSTRPSATVGFSCMTGCWRWGMRRRSWRAPGRRRGGLRARPEGGGPLRGPQMAVFAATGSASPRKWPSSRQLARLRLATAVFAAVQARLRLAIRA
jgi:hypothetical protein